MMHEEVLIRRIEAVEQLLARNHDIVDNAARNIQAEQSADSVETLRQRINEKRAAGRRLKVGIIGRVKAGKSSLINALLFDGKAVLPKAATPMTAALTTISHGERVSATVEFFSDADVQKLRAKSEEYEERLAAEVEKRLERLSSREGSNASARAVSEPDRGKVTRQVAEEIRRQNPALDAAFDLFTRIQKSGLGTEVLGTSRILEAASIQEMKGELQHYVGRDGAYMPFTKALHLTFPDDSLKDLEIIDTPGVNDAVSSRERRTYDMLGECDAVFLVSPAGQFLNAQDLELAGRLTTRDGLREIFIVASQSDSQLHASERRENNGELPRVVTSLRRRLAVQADSILRSQDNPVLRQVAGSGEQRLLLTSGICQTLLTQPEGDWDDETHHTYKLLIDNYPDYFGDSQDKRTHLEMLSGRDAVKAGIERVRGEKERIQAEGLENYLSAQVATTDKFIAALMAHFEKQHEKIRGTDFKEATEKLGNLEKKHGEGVRAADHVYQEEVIDFGFMLSDTLKQVNKTVFSDNSSTMKDAQGVGTETYQAEKDGVLAGIARLFRVGGHETRTREVATINCAEVRFALEQLRDYVEDGIGRQTRHLLFKWRQRLAASLSEKLREVIGAEYVDMTSLSGTCRNIVREIDLPEPELPHMPDELASSTRMTGREAEAYFNVAQDYAERLREAARAYSRVMEQQVKELAKRSVAEEVMKRLRAETSQLKDMVDNKAITLDKIDRLGKDLSEVRHG